MGIMNAMISGQGMRENIERLEYILDKQLTWITAADLRLRFLVPIATAMFGTLVYFPEKIIWHSLGGVLAGCAIVLLTASIFFAACATFPRTVATQRSLIFFGSVAATDRLAYKKSLAFLNEAAYMDDLAEQCHINAVIARKKFKWVRFGMACLFAAMIPWAWCLYLSYSPN